MLVLAPESYHRRPIGPVEVPGGSLVRRSRSALGGKSPLERADRPGFRRGGVEFRLATLGQRDGRPHEATEERVRTIRSAAELRMELAGHEPRVVLTRS